MHITLCLLVRNEQEIVRENILYHLNLGVKRFLVMDHLSTDNTRTILEDLISKGLDLRIYPQESPTYYQNAWMTFLSQEAHRLGTDWVMPCDADEFWLPPNGQTIPDYLRGVEAEGFGAVYGMHNNNKAIKGIEPFYKNHYFAPCPWQRKVLHKSCADIALAMGNHYLESPPVPVKDDPSLRVMHYKDRNVQVMYNKLVIGGEALESTKEVADNMGTHWREGLAAYRKGEFEQYVNFFFNTVEDLEKQQDCYKDDTIEQLIIKSMQTPVPPPVENKTLGKRDILLRLTK